MMPFINSSSFFINPLNESAYELTIQFRDEKALHSESKFIFVQEPVKEGRIVDVFTKNGKCSPNLLANLFTANDLKEVKNAKKQLGGAVSDPLVAVLDLKEPHNRYLPCHDTDCPTIAKCEEIVCDFLKGKHGNSPLPSEAIEIGSYLQKDLTIDFMIKEGTLKKAILEKGGFTEAQAEYLNADSGAGAIGFCQVAEFFMNGFKTGQSVKTSSELFLPHAFIQPLSSKFEIFAACTVSTVFYPSLYKKIYSPTGEFATTLNSAFAVSGKFNKSTHITTLQVEKKKP